MTELGQLLDVTRGTQKPQSWNSRLPVLSLQDGLLQVVGVNPSPMGEGGARNGACFQKGVASGRTELSEMP